MGAKKNAKYELKKLQKQLHMQKNIKNVIKHVRLTFLRQKLTAESHEHFS